MSKTFRPCDISLLLPPDLRDGLPERHLDRSLLDVVQEDEGGLAAFILP